ncbi:uncharacterized protein IWZ02DRAFT_147332 [Phyllosticta citriasiana]|uniref:uncharacterized protein n=1 Tax=Phyllosticta citriasiana TaxID=595635 RepID=UPI0030FDB9AE
MCAKSKRGHLHSWTDTQSPTHSIFSLLFLPFALLLSLAAPLHFRSLGCPLVCLLVPLFVCLSAAAALAACFLPLMLARSPFLVALYYLTITLVSFNVYEEGGGTRNADDDALRRGPNHTPTYKPTFLLSSQ